MTAQINISSPSTLAGTQPISVLSDVVGIEVVTDRLRMSDVTVVPSTGTGTAFPAIVLNKSPNFSLERVEVKRESQTSRFDSGIDLHSAISGSLFGTIVCNSVTYNLRIRNDATAGYPSNAVKDFGGYYAGAGTANVELKDSHGASFFGSVIEVGPIGIKASGSNNATIVGCWLENGTNNLDVSDSQDWVVVGGNFGDSGMHLRSGVTGFDFFGCTFPGAVTLDHGVTNTVFWGCKLPSIADGWSNNGGKTNQRFLCNVGGIGLYTDYSARTKMVQEQGSGDIFRIWRSDFAQFDLSRDADGANGWKYQLNGNAYELHSVSGGETTLRFDFQTGYLDNRTGEYRINGVKVIGPRLTGWAPMAGTANSTTAFNTSTMTHEQACQRIAALEAAMLQHGLIGI